MRKGASMGLGSPRGAGRDASEINCAGVEALARGRIDARHLDSVPETSPRQEVAALAIDEQVRVDGVEPVVHGRLDHQPPIYPFEAWRLPVERLVGRKADDGMVGTERGYRVIEVVETVEERDIRRPDSLGAGHSIARPRGNLLEDETVALPGHKIARATAGDEARGVGLHAGGEHVVRVALPDDAGVVHGGEVALHARVDRACILGGAPESRRGEQCPADEFPSRDPELRMIRAHLSILRQL